MNSAGGPADHDVCRARGPDATSDTRTPGRRGGDRQRARRPIPDQRAGGVEAPQGPRARRADHARALGTAAPVAARGSGVEGSSRLAGALRPARRAAAGRALTETVITIVRVFEAPRRRIWQEWTEPARFADWFGAHECVIPLDTVAMDVRPGGLWRATMFCDEGRREIHWSGEYREVLEPERLVLTFADEPEYGAYAVVTVLL